MKTAALFFLVCYAFLAVTQSGSALRPDPPNECADCAEWNLPQQPFKVFGNTYYVGPAGLSALLISTDAGLILLDGGLPQSAAVIDANIRTLGFRTENVRLIVNSHAHYDHAGGIAALQRVSGAIVGASASGARALRQGEPTTDDPQYGFGRKANAFAAVKNLRVVSDGEVLRVGNVGLTAHLTPGHTPGSTTWTWQSCEGTRCLNMVYADSLTAVSAPGFRFTAGIAPTAAEGFRHTIAKVEQLPCDIMFTTHPGASGLATKLAERVQKPEANPFIDSNACRAYAARARKGLDERVAEEKASPPV